MSDTPLSNSESSREKGNDVPESSDGGTPHDDASRDDAPRDGTSATGDDTSSEKPPGAQKKPSQADGADYAPASASSTGKTSADEASTDEASPKEKKADAANVKASDAASSTDSAAKGKNVPPEKAPQKRSGGKRTGSDGSPAAALKGLQKDESEERRGLLAGSRRLQSMLLSDRPLGVRNMLWASLAVLSVIVVLLLITGRFGTVTQSIASAFEGPEAPAEERTLDEATGESDDGTFAFADLGGHPDRALDPYFAGTMAGRGEGDGRSALIRRFRQLVDVYVKRYGEDDNFSMRLTSGGEQDTLLEVFTFEEERQQYIDAGRPLDYNWGRIDNMRRAKTRDLVDKWVARGVPQGPIRVKWGLADKTRQARERDKPFIEYEIRLARFFEKSLLMTEIGTKETFNQDELVSNVNAKSRYQLMPSLLSEYGLGRYRLPTSAGNNVLVAEEQHPLLSMEPAFKHASASVNAMGHEIPGISAYHTGVNNIYNEILVKFLRNAQEYISPGVTTADAYIWGVTDGFDIVTRNSSFGQFSRTYVVGAYGALKATEEAIVDTSETMLADRVRLTEGQTITLNDLLTTLAQNGGGDLPWKMADSLSLYDRFRKMNKHYHLPAGPSGSADSVVVGVPERGNVTLSATAGGEPVRFFLPPGARTILKSNSQGNLIDEDAVFRFNHDTYPDPNDGLRQRADREYSQLIDEIRRFGFTDENREELKRLAEQFDQMAASDPSHYRRSMRDVIAKHRSFWRYPGWESVKQTVEAVLGRDPVQPAQPAEPNTQPLETRQNVESNAR